VAVAVIDLFTRDTALRRTGQVQDFTSLTLTLRFNAPHTWVLTLPADDADLLDTATGIILVRDGMTLLSGPIIRRQRTLSEGRRVLTVSGADDTVWLQRRLALPVPSGPPYTAVAYDDKSAAAETVLRYFVDRNLGPAATTDRRLVPLTLAADQARGTSVRGRGRFHTLLELLQSIALAGGDLGFRIVQAGTALEFQVYVPEDRTATAVFSEDLGNLAGYEYATATPEADYVIVGGQGEGTARIFAEGSSASPGQPRSETFRDRRDTDDPAVLAQTRDETLAELAQPTALSFTPVDTPALAFGSGYFLGDRVTVVIDGVEITDVVREVGVSVTADQGERLTPVIGTPGASSPTVPLLFDRLTRQGRRVSNLERR
jgi:hypothetical protein